MSHMFMLQTSRGYERGYDPLVNGRVRTIEEPGELSPNSGTSPADDCFATQVASVRAALYAQVRHEELAEIDREIAALEEAEGITSAELVERLTRGDLAMTMRRAWWFARWRLRARLRASTCAESR